HLFQRLGFTLQINRHKAPVGTALEKVVVQTHGREGLLGNCEVRGRSDIRRFLLLISATKHSHRIVKIQQLLCSTAEETDACRTLVQHRIIIRISLNGEGFEQSGEAALVADPANFNILDPFNMYSFQGVGNRRYFQDTGVRGGQPAVFPRYDHDVTIVGSIDGVVRKIGGDRLQYGDYQVRIYFIELYPLHEQGVIIHVPPDQMVELGGKKAGNPADPRVRRFGHDQVVFFVVGRKKGLGVVIENSAAWVAEHRFDTGPEIVCAF